MKKNMENKDEKSAEKKASKKAKFEEMQESWVITQTKTTKRHLAHHNLHLRLSKKLGNTNH